MIKIGVRAHDFGRATAEYLFLKIADAGFECIQLAMPKALEGVNSFDDVNLKVVKDIEAALVKSGLELAVLGCYLDLSTSDEAVASKNVATTHHILEVAKDLGAHTVASESTYGRVEEQDRDAFVERVIKSVAKIMVKARELDMNYSLEPVFYHAVSNKERFLRVAHAVGRDHFKVIYDPTNMMDPKYLQSQSDYIQSTLFAFEPYADVIHYKDFLVNDDGLSYRPCRLGDGRLDGSVVRDYLAKRQQSSIYLIREELEVQNAEYEVAYLKDLASRKQARRSAIKANKKINLHQNKHQACQVKDFYESITDLVHCSLR